MKFRFIFISLIVLALHCPAGSFNLTENGKTVCSIVVSPDAAAAEKHAAEELAKYLSLTSGGERPAIGTAPQPGTYPVYLKKIKDPATGEQGFRITAQKDGLTVDASEDCGILFGVYNLLKKYAGARWLVPGKDGEYLSSRKTISVPEGSYTEKPDFQFRYYLPPVVAWNSPRWDSWDWCLRNGIRIDEFSGIVNMPSLKAGLKKRAAIGLNGSHCFSYLLTGRGVVNRPTGKYPTGKYETYVNQLFAEHPEWFPLINGKRVPIYHCGGEPQPCTSNPEVIRRFARHIIAIQKASPDNSPYWFMNNDLPKWCECSECVKLDPPSESAEGIVSTRYWKFLNAVLQEVRKELPDVRIMAVTYQNYSMPPQGIKLDSGLGVYNLMLSNHRRCWKHQLDDASCPTNKWYLNYNRVWDSIGIPIFTWEECYVFGESFLPNEKAVVDTLRFYRKNMPNIQGFRTEVVCPDGIFNGNRGTFSNKNNWYMMWQMMYLTAAFQWKVDQDYDSIYEEINSLYYGKGWDGGMREFRRLLADAYFSSPGCWGYGHSVMTGKFLDRIGLAKQLNAALDAAEKAAALDPDPRALSHVKRDREFFQRTWLKNYQDYLQNFRDIKAYPRQGKIVIDGNLDEPDWKNADTVTRFKHPDGTLARYQSLARITYDSENIYFGIEMEEPAGNRIKAEITKHDGPVWEDSTIEIFLNPPILGSTYYQLIFNKNGVLFDGIKSQGSRAPDPLFESNAVMKSSYKNGRWIAEIRVPVRPILGTPMKPGEVIKINIFRNRIINGERGAELSSWSAAMPHNTDVFHPVTFTTARVAGGRFLPDPQLWRNGTFKEPARKPYIPAHWKWNGQLPNAWHLSNAKQYGGEGAYLNDTINPALNFIRLKSGFIFQLHKIRTPKIKVVCKLRGNGAVAFEVIRYAAGMKKYLGHSVIRKYQLNDQENWKTLTFEYNRPGSPDEEQSFGIRPHGTVDIAEIYLTPIEPEK